MTTFHILMAGFAINFISRMIGKLVWFYWKPRLKKRRETEGYGW